MPRLQSSSVERVLMSQADLHNDSPQPDRAAGSLPPGSRSLGGASVPGVAPPPPALPGANGQAQTLPPVPPPPPPRATLPPVRPATVPTGHVTGVGSARGVRWKGMLDRLRPQRPAIDGADGGGVNGEPDQFSTDRVTRAAPPWLVSFVLHLILLLVLALITTPGKKLGRVLLEIGQADASDPVELAEFSFDSPELDQEEEVMMEDAMVELETADLLMPTELNEIDEIPPLDFGAGAEMASVKPMFEGRTGAMKQALLAIYGGTPETQEAVPTRARVAEAESAEDRSVEHARPLSRRRNHRESDGGDRHGVTGVLGRRTHA